MDLDSASRLLWELGPGETREVYEAADNTIVTATRTDKICPHDFAVGLRIPGQAEFRPTHIRLFFDLYLKRVSNLSDARRLFYLVECIYQGEDPEAYKESLSELRFPMQLDSPEVNLYCEQLLMIEQEFNYGPQGCKKGKVDPPREFHMRFVRWIASGESEIDRIIYVAVRNVPPSAKYRNWNPSWLTPL